VAVFFTSFVLFCFGFGAPNAVFPFHIPALGVTHRGRDSLIKQYFDLGLNYVEMIIMSFLLLTHG